MPDELRPVTHTAYLGLGANLGDREATIRQAIEMIGEQIGTVDAQSALYYSEPWGFESEHGFVNAVVRVSTTLTPFKLLDATQRIERQLGKTALHATERQLLTPNSSLLTPHSSLLTPNYHDRPIDIDILLYDDLTIDTPRLKIPHPLMNQRPFVIEPLKSLINP